MKLTPTIGALVELEPWDDIQYRQDAESEWEFIQDRTPFQFRVAGELTEDGHPYGFYGTVHFGPERYLGLTCSIMKRAVGSTWEAGAVFRVGPSIVEPEPGYEPARNGNIPFCYHPDGTKVDGYPQMLRFGGIRLVGVEGQF